MSLTDLLLSNKRAPQHAHTLANHRDRKLMFGLEPINYFFQGGIVLELKSIPQSPFRRPIFILGSSDGLRETKEG